jgi:hypothetical protein
MLQKFTGLVEPVLGAETSPLLQALRQVEQPGQLETAMQLVSR